MWSLCRACLGARVSLRPLRGGVARMLAAVTLVQIAENDGLPSLICLQCIQRMHNAFEFKKLCEDSDVKLRHCLEYQLNPNSLNLRDDNSDNNENIPDIQDLFKFNLSSFDNNQMKSDVKSENEISNSCDILPNEDPCSQNGVKEEYCTEFDTSAAVDDPQFPSTSGKIDAAKNKNISKSSPQNDSGKLTVEDLKSFLGLQPFDSFSFNLKDENLNDTQKCTNSNVKEIDDNFIQNSKKSKSDSSSSWQDCGDDNLALKFVCTKCPTQFNTRKDLKKHLKLSHVKNKTGRSVTCKICNRSFSYKQTLTRHMRIHQENPKNKLCTFCGKNFLRADDLKRHTRIHTGERPYSCDQCPKTYKQSSELKDHIKSHSAAKCYMCSECGKSLATRNGLYIHMKVHRGEKNRECKICGNKFITNGELNSHINHIHLDEKPFKCNYNNCTRSFTTKLSLKTHLRAHTGDKPYKCTICDKSLATSSSLNEHKRIHTGEKPKKCTECDKQLGNSQALKKHMRIHTGERPYQCKICFGKFICASTLSSHIKIKHMEKQHECNVCQKKFALGTKLRQHMKLHTDEKTYNCQACDVIFNQRSKLYQHMKSHDKNKEIVIRNDVVEADKTQLINDIITMPQLPMPHMLISQYL